MDEKLENVGLEYDKSKGYAERVHCENCHWFNTIYIPYKVKIRDYLRDKRCERCQCIGVLY